MMKDNNTAPMLEPTPMIQIPSGTMKKIAPNLHYREKMTDIGCPNGTYILTYHPSREVNVNEPLYTDNFELACSRRDRRMIQVKARCKAVKTKRIQSGKPRQWTFRFFKFQITITHL